MAYPNIETAAPDGHGRGGRISRKDRLALIFKETTRPAKPGQREWHVGHPKRRRKSEAELIADGAYWELLDRAAPGRYAKRGQL